MNIRNMCISESFCELSGNIVVDSESFGCIDMLNLCIYESFELLIVNVGYEYERVL